MNPRLKSISEKILDKAGVPKEEEFGSVIAILMVISIILTIIRVIQECNKSKLSTNCTAKEKCDLYGEEIKSYAVKRGWFTKMRIKKLLRQKMSKDQYAKYGLQLLNAILDSGENLTSEETMTLVEAANV
jgi:hypothetical protein